MVNVLQLLEGLVTYDLVKKDVKKIESSIC